MTRYKVKQCHLGIDELTGIERGRTSNDRIILEFSGGLVVAFDEAALERLMPYTVSVKFYRVSKI